MPSTKRHLKSSGRTCQLSGKKPQRGWNYAFLRAHYNPTSRRRYDVNLQTVHTKDENGAPVTLKVAASVLKRSPELRTSLKAYTDRKKVKRPKGKRKHQLLQELGVEGAS
jgi:ribosomal protein L28